MGDPRQRRFAARQPIAEAGQVVRQHRQLVHREDEHQLIVRDAPAAVRRGRVFLDDHVGVHAAGGDRGEPRAAWKDLRAAVDRALRPAPFHQLLRHHERRIGKVDIRVEPAGVDRRRDLPMLDLQQDLGQTRHARCRQQVADIRFDRTEVAELLVAGGPAERIVQPQYLDRIPQPGARPMALHVGDRGRVHVGLIHRLADRQGLQIGVGHVEAVALAGVGHRRALDHTVDLVPVGNRPVQPLEQHRADALADHRAVRADAVAVDRRRGDRGEVALGGFHRGVGVVHQVEAAGQHHPGLVVLEHLAGGVDAGQGRRAHGVDEQARSCQAVEIRHRHRNGRHARPGGHRAVEQVALETVVRVVVGHGADQHADIAAIAAQHGLPGVAGVFKGLHRHLEEQPDFRRHVVGVDLGHLEVAVIELVDVLDEGTVDAGGLAQHLAVLVVELVVVPALRGEIAHAVDAVGQVLPEPVHIGGAGVIAAKADHRDIVLQLAVLDPLGGCRRGALLRSGAIGAAPGGGETIERQ